MLDLGHGTWNPGYPTRGRGDKVTRGHGLARGRGGAWELGRGEADAGTRRLGDAVNV
jgi:hypothetical protein